MSLNPDTNSDISDTVVDGSAWRLALQNRQYVRVADQPDRPLTFADWIAELSRFVGQNPDAMSWSDV